MKETDLACDLLNDYNAWMFIKPKGIAFHAQQPAQAIAIAITKAFQQDGKS